MKRLLILLLLVLMPLQLVWAAAGACCGEEREASTQHVCLQWQQQCGDEPEAGAQPDDDGCDCCHHFSGSALTAMPSDVALPATLPGLRFDSPHYLSHIPDLVPPPDRHTRA